MEGLAPLLTLPGLADDLSRVEQELGQAVRSGDPFLTEVASHLVQAGGKRLRPALALVAAAAGRAASGAAGVAAACGAGPASASEDVVRGAVAVELVHLGSLYHDDVMDEARTRRNVESVNARWGNLVAILAGDFLLARASELASSLGTEIAGLLAATIGRLCEGQVRELSHAYDTSRTEESYLSAISGKTAALFATACRVGALAGGVDRPTVEALTRYGDRLGMTFQIVDDVLDVVATDAELGKPAGNDLVEGVYTLPVIRALADSRTGAALAELLGKPGLGAAETDRARDLVGADGAVDGALAIARRFAEEAQAALAPLVPSTASAALAALGHHLVEALPHRPAVRHAG